MRRFVILAVMALGCGKTEAEPSAAEAGVEVSVADTSESSDSSVDMSVDAAEDSGCAPQSVADFRATWHPPKPAHPTACSKSQLDGWVENCADNFSGAKCKAFTSNTANTTCLACVFSTEDEANWGPMIVIESRGFNGNIGGCIALLTGDVSETSCGARVQAVDECVEYACLAVCPEGGDLTSPTQNYAKCTQAARKTVCKPFVDAAACESNPAYDACTKHTSFADYFLGLGAIACSNSATDAGTD